jgi:predicted dehydrogenase
MREINVGLIGSGFMGKAHCLAYSSMPVLFQDAPAKPRKYLVADVNDELAKAAAENFGFEKWTSNWEDVIGDNKVDLVDLVTPNDVHKPMAIAAAQAGKHVFSEKPLSLSGNDSKEVYEAVKKAGVKNGMGFHYRKVPAVAYAKQLVEQGKIGDVFAFRGCYLNDWARDPMGPLSWRFQKAKAGSGVIGDQCTHVMDMARYLLGEIERVTAWAVTLIKDRPLQTSAFDALGRKPDPKNVKMGKVDVDDACGLLVEFASGTRGMLEANRCATGWKNHLSFEINGSRGSIYFDWERNNELHYYSTEDEFEAQGYRRIVMGPGHPNGQYFWPIAGINIGYTEATAVNLQQMLNAIVEDTEFDPSFEDGWRIEEIVDAALESHEKGVWVDCHR